MSESQYAHHPSWDMERDEPYLPLPDFPDLRLTPFRAGDDEGFIEISNDATVRQYSFRRPYPFLQEHMGIVWEDIHPKSVKAIDEIRPFRRGSSPQIPTRVHLQDPYYPLSVIRNQSTGRMAGLMGFRHSKDVPGAWELAYNLLPAYRGKRLVKEAWEAAVQGWLEWTGIDRVVAVENVASAAVLKSCGFKERRTFMLEWPASKGGGLREIHEWEWSAEAGDSLEG